MNYVQKCFLQKQLMESPQTISSLVAKTGGITKLMEFFDWICDNPQRVFPIMLQGGSDNDFEDVFQGQPVVWDGGFYLDDEGELRYAGYAGPSGFGGKVERLVKVTDQIMAA